MVSPRTLSILLFVFAWSLPCPAQQTQNYSYQRDMSGLRTRSQSAAASYYRSAGTKRKSTVRQQDARIDRQELEERLELNSDQQSKRDRDGGSFDETNSRNDDDEDDFYDEDLDGESDIAPQPSTLETWPRKSIFEIRLNPNDYSADSPPDQSAKLISSYNNDWRLFECRQKLLTWQAPNISHHPLYFEDVALERYGQVFLNDYWQTAKSASHLLSNFFLWPIHGYHDPVFSCEFPLGYCRPGNCTRSIYEKKFWGRIR